MSALSVEEDENFERQPSRLSGGFSHASESNLNDYSDFSSRPTQRPSSFTVERAVEEEVQRDESIPVLNTILKWIFAVFLFSAMLFCLVTSKVSLLLIGVYYNNLNGNETRTINGNQKNYSYSKESIFILLTMIMIIPQLCSFLLNGFKAITKKKALPGPTTIAALWVSHFLHALKRILQVN